MTGRPTAAPPMTRNSKGALCYPDHANMAEVMAEEDAAIFAKLEAARLERGKHDRARYERERRSVAR